MAWTLRKTDAFTDDNGTALAAHDADWTVHSGACEIQSNQCACGTVRGRASVSTSLFNDQAVEVDVKDQSNHGGPMLRHTSTGGNGNDCEAYYASARGGVEDDLLLFRGDDGSWTELAKVVWDFSDNDTVRIEAVGDQIRVLVNSVEKIGATTDATYASGDSAIIVYDLTNWHDNFNAYDAPAAGGFVPYPYPRGLRGGHSAMSGGLI